MDDLTGSLEGPLKDLAQASTLPAKVYCDADVAGRERQAIFRSYWQYVAHESQLPKLGSSLFVDVAGVPIVILRTRDGLHAYEAVCRHRAGPLEACHAGGKDFLRCRYHGWSYGHDDVLINATEMPASAGEHGPGEITIFSGSLYAVCFLPAILLGLHWRKGTARAVLASMLVGTVVLLAWLLTGLGDVLHEVFPALAASCLTYVIIALNSPPALDRWPTPADQA